MRFEIGVLRGFLVGELSVPNSEDVRRWPLDPLTFGMMRALPVVLISPLVLEGFSSWIESTETGFPTFCFHLPVPEFFSVRGGLGGALLAAVDVLEVEVGSLSLEALRSVAGGVNMFKTGRLLSPIASRACSRDRVG